MKNRQSRVLPLVCSLLAIGVGLAARYFLTATPRSSAGIVNADDQRAPSAPDLAARDSARPLLPSAPTTAAEAEPASARRIDDRKNVSTPTELELADAIWMNGRLVLPEGTPVGEEVEVIATGRKFKSLPPYRARVEPNGNFRIAFAPGTKTGKVAIDAPHLFLDEDRSVKPGGSRQTEELLLEPRLGGCIQGRLTLPVGSESLAAGLAGKLVTIEGWSQDYDDHAQRSGALDANLRFELRGLPPKCAFDLQFKSDVLVTLREEDIHVEAGLNLVREFPLALGARVRGRVSDARGELLEGRTLMVVSIGPDEDASSAVNESVKLEPDGSFDARGIRPGKIGLWASAKQRLPAKLDVGELADGELREGVELVLQPGARIAGRVSWPDGSPAADARVQLQKLVESNEFAPDDEPYLADTVNLRTNAAGEFSFAGLAQAQHTLTAQARPAAAAASGSKGKAQIWRARLEKVAADTLDVELKLQAGLAIHGVVVDEVGAPVKRFSVTASRREPGPQGLPDTVGSLYSSADGRFELIGLQEAVYKVAVSAPGHDDTQVIEIALPAESETFTFVAIRRANLSGVVVRPDGAPAARAELYVDTGNASSRGAETGRTNSRGEFNLQSAPTGSVRVRARLDGFATSEAWSAVVSPGESLANLRLVLRAGGTIQGEVHALRAGEVLAGRSIHGQGESEEFVCSAKTDASGHFVMEHVDPGEFDLTLEAGEAQISALTPDGSDTDWELRSELERHARVSVSDGATTHVSFGSKARAAVLLSGIVRRGATPEASVRVRCERIGDDDPKELQFALSDASGRYEFALDGAGSYLVQAQPHGSDGTRVGRTVDVPAGGLRGFDLSISNGRIAGSVFGPDGATVDPASVRLVYRGEHQRPPVVECENERQFGSLFEFEDLPAGSYLLEVNSSRGGLRARRRESDSGESPQLCSVQRELSLAEGEQLTDLKIELQQAATATIQVQFADGTRPESGWIDLRRAEGANAAPSWQYFSDGVFENDRLEPGVFDVRAGAEQQVSAWTSRVEIRPGQQRELTLVLGPAGHLKFDARDARGASVSASVQVYDSRDRALLSQPVATWDSAGPIAPGPCRVVATNSSGLRTEAKSEVIANETVEVSLSFP